MLYQATIDKKEVCFEAETTAQLHNDILNAGLYSLPTYTIVLLDDDGEPEAFDDKQFMNDLREAFDESVCEAHYAAEHNRSNRS